ncbi:MAG: hypothetical protein RQ735_08265 [Flavobacteriaceae bacterium]|nr:hypothetical protein [Flavobacteriaceae bacterium]
MNKKEILMPKERSVSNTLIFCFLSLFTYTTIPAIAQFHIDGEYDVKQSIGMSVAEAYVNYNFNKDGTFEFHSGSHNCNGDCVYANGTYQIQDSIIIINYATEPVLVSNVERREWVEQSDSITIRFKVTNIDEICGVPCVFFWKEGKMFEPNRAYGAEYRFKKQKGTMVFEAASIGYYTVYFAFSGEESTEVRFNLRLYEGSAMSGFTRKARVVESRNGLVTAILFENGTKISLQE